MSRQSSKHGMHALVLIEAVLGIALLGTLLTTIVVSGSKYNHMWHLAQKRQAACDIADELLETIWLNREQYPAFETLDTLPELPGPEWSWSTSNRAEQLPGLSGYEARVMTLEIMNQSMPGKPVLRVALLLDVVKK